MNELERKRILLSKTEFDDDGGETVYATISNDWAKKPDGSPIFGKEFSYEMSGYQLHGPIPKDVRGGFSSSQDAEAAAREEYKNWREGKVPRHVQVTQQEYWEMKYRTNRYLRHLTDQELATRFDDVMNNTMNLTRNQKIDFTDATDSHFSEYFAHVLEEYRLRGSGIPADQLGKLHVPNYDWPGIDSAFDAFTNLNLEPGTYTLKYSEEEFLIDAIEQGIIRISPASKYDDPSLNYAIRDDELSFALQSQGRVEHKRDEVVTARTDFYVYCMANEFSLRLFGDFKADACLVITDPFVFLNRLGNAVLEQLRGWNGFARPVTYLDPARAGVAEVDIFTAKSFRFAYQREYRLVWTPPGSRENLDYLYVKLGSLHDCCKLIVLKDKGRGH